MGWPWGYAVITAAVCLFVAVATQTALPSRSTPPDVDRATVRAAAATLDDTLTFPLPAGGESPAGRFNSLSALQCRRHGGSGGGFGGGSSSGGDGKGGSGKFGATADRGPGWVFVANSSARPVFIPFAPGTCAAPLSDAFQLQYLAAPAHTDAKFAKSGASTDVDVGGNVREEYEWAGNTLLSWGVHIARDRAPIGGELTAERFSPQPCASRGGGPPPEGVLCEKQLVRMLGQHRGTVEGRVDRWIGVYDVALITRANFGWALDRNAYVVASSDLVSAAGGRGSAVVTYTDRTGTTRPVLLGEAGLLSLGRAALADPSWLGPSVPGDVSATVSLQTAEDSMIRRRASWKMHPGLGGGRAGATHNRSATATPWLEEVAYALCIPPVESFVGDPGLCTGVRQRPPSPPVTLTADGVPVAATLDLAARTFRGQTGVSVRWQVLPTRRLETTAPPCDLSAAFKWNDVRRQPIWLLGRGDREVPRAGWSANPAEADLARHLRTCRFAGARFNVTAVSKWRGSLIDRAAELSQDYRRDLFLVDPPAPPATATDFVLAALVVVPEAVALVQVLLQPAPLPEPTVWSGRTRRTLSVALVIIAGAVSLLGAGFLDAQEQAGSSWRAATLRIETRIAANETEQALVTGRRIDYSGRPVWHIESLFLVARPGYRPATTRKLFISLSVVYGVLTFMVLTLGLWRWTSRRRAAAAAAEEPFTVDWEG